MAGASAEVTQAIALAVSETVTNAVVHAYDREDCGQVRVSCQVDGERFIVEGADEGAGIGTRRESPGIGHGWRWWAPWHWRSMSPRVVTGAAQPSRWPSVTLRRSPRRRAWSCFAYWLSRLLPTFRASTSFTKVCCAGLPLKSRTMPR
jgi:hypothetical protein